MQGTEEASTIEAYRAIVSAGSCTFTLLDNLPVLPPIPAGGGSQQNGNYSQALFAGTSQYWALNWTLSTEVSSQRIPLKADGTWWNTGSSPCAGNATFGVYVHRNRDVACPRGYLPNGTTAPLWTYCYRSAVTRDPTKNLGAHCPIGNPVNGATGNKFQAETDYQGAGGSPLRFARHYNSYIADYYSTWSAVGVKSSLGPSWRSSYERVVRFSDSSTYPAAFIYRPDGRTLSFKSLSNQFVADADISDRLVRLFDLSGVPTGWQYTIAESEEVETYDVSGRLLSIKSRSGVTQTLTYSSGRLTAVVDSSAIS